MKKALFSIIIPVYNVESFIEHCIASAIGQTFNNYEIICVNDGSTDKSEKIIKQYAINDRRVRVISQKNKGLSSARNAGIAKAKGNYILLLDGDDWLEEDALETLSYEVDSGIHDMICFKGSLYHQNKKKEIQDIDLEEGVFTGWQYYNRYVLYPRKFHFVSAVLRLYKKDFLLQNHLLFKEGIYHEDNLFTPLACYYANSVKVINVKAYNYRIRPGSITQTSSFKRIADKISVINELCSFFIPLKNINKRKLYRILASDYLGVVLKIGKSGYNYRDIKELIDHKYFRKVSFTPRHRFMYFMLWIHPKLLLIYIKLAKIFQ